MTNTGTGRIRGLVPVAVYSVAEFAQRIGAPDWLSGRVLLCGAAAVLLLCLMVLFRSLQKLSALLLLATLVLGGYFLIRDVWMGAPQLLPRELESELDHLAARNLRNVEAVRVWEAMEHQWREAPAATRQKLESGGDPARAEIAAYLEKRVADLRKEGKKSAAEELARLRVKIAPN